MLGSREYYDQDKEYRDYVHRCTAKGDRTVGQVLDSYIGKEVAKEYQMRKDDDVTLPPKDTCDCEDKSC